MVRLVKTEMLSFGLLIATQFLWFTIVYYSYGFYQNGQILLFAASIASLIFLTALHGSLTHEVVHHHPTSIGWLNFILLGLPIEITYPFYRYRELHLLHHNAGDQLTDPIHDTESYYLSDAALEKTSWLEYRLLMLCRTLFGRMFFGPIILHLYYWRSEVKSIFNGNFRIARIWFFHLILVGVVFYWVNIISGFPVWLYLIIVLWPAHALLLVRSYIEHRPDNNEQLQSAIVEGGVFWSFLFLNNNYHVLHHQHPDIAWYLLPKLYRDQKDYWQKLNNHYVYPSYDNVFKLHALKPPAWLKTMSHPILGKVKR